MCDCTRRSAGAEGCAAPLAQLPPPPPLPPPGGAAGPHATPSRPPSPPRSAAIAKDGPPSLPYQSLYEMFQASVAKFPDNNCLGHREGAGYAWLTYKQTEEQVRVWPARRRRLGGTAGRQ